MQPIKTEYRGFDLIYLTHEDQWSIGGDSTKDRRTFEKLSDVKIYIDEILKEKFKRFEVFLRDTFGDSFKLVTVTSRIDDKHFWTMNKDQVREKASLNYLYTMNDKNKKILDALETITTRIEELKDQKESLIRNMDKYKEV
jgi:hypothetical protein